MKKYINHCESENENENENVINYYITTNKPDFFIQRMIIIEYSYTPTIKNLIYIDDSNLNYVYKKITEPNDISLPDRVKKINKLLSINNSILLVFKEDIETIPGYFYDKCLSLQDAINIYNIKEQINKENWFIFIDKINKLPYDSVPYNIYRISNVITL
jgi:hypothetical protein